MMAYTSYNNYSGYKPLGARRIELPPELRASQPLLLVIFIKSVYDTHKK